jgi:hypothetical protein
MEVLAHMALLASGLALSRCSSPLSPAAQARAGPCDGNDAFQGTDAQKTMTALWNAFGRCKSFTQSSNGVTATENAIVTMTDSSADSDDGSAAVAMAERIASRLSAAETGK